MKVDLRAKAKVEIRLCTPLGKVDGTITGLDELFMQTLYPDNQNIHIAICSPWIEASVLEKISDLCYKCGVNSVHFCILTFRAHKTRHEAALIKCFRNIRNKPFTASFTVGRLPTKANSKGFREDILHAKIYAVAHGKNSIIDKAGIVKEAFFGSANFTTAGIGSKGMGSSRKFEIVARVEDDDPEGKKSVMQAFCRLWNICDEQCLGPVEEEDNNIYRNFKRYPSGS